jgi:transmembrane sensor
METRDSEALLRDYQNGTCSKQERLFVERWLLFHNAEGNSQINEDEFDRLQTEEWDKVRVIFKQRRNNKMLWLSAAAVLIVLGLWLYAGRIGNTSHLSASAHSDILPGTVGATLTLTDGRKIRLSEIANGEIANESGFIVTKTSSGQIIYKINPQDSDDINNSSLRDGRTKQSYNILSTAKGETYQVCLPDGSLVYLNAASSLTYPANLNERGKRRVKLDGEGYFEVAKDKDHPFLVESKDQVIEVLGTHFNINSYPDDPVTRTTLIEGSVKVSSLRGSKQSQFLKPNQQSIIKGQFIGIVPVNTDLVMAWRKGYFRFVDDPIENVMAQLTRWYNITPRYQGQPTKERFNGVISRDKDIKEVLRMLERTSTVHFKVEGRRVVVMP